MPIRPRDRATVPFVRGCFALAFAWLVAGAAPGPAMAAGVTVSPTAGLVTTEAGGTAQFTVVLQTQPAADVTIGLSSSDLTEGTVSAASLTFTALDWDTPQTVTVTGVDDLLDDGDIPYTIVTATATSADLAYHGIDPDDVSVTNTDNDGAGIVVTPTSGLVTTEAGGTAQFTVVLTSQPSSNVMVGISSSDPTEGSVSTASLNFTAGNWSNPRQVTVTGVDDFIVDGTIGYTIVTAAAVSGDPAYSGMDPANVSVTNTDNDVAGITVSPTSGLVTTEAGGTAQFTIVLQSQPSASVSIGLSSSDLTEGTVTPGNVTFTTGNWNVAQTVTVAGVDDFIVDGNVAYAIVTAAAVSADPDYNGMVPANVSVTNTDNDAVGITVAPTSGLVTTEAGGTAQFTIVLQSQPTASVSIGLSSSDPTEGTVAPSSVTFTTGNWNVAQSVTVTGVNDFIADGNVAYTIVTAAATSADPAYNGLVPANVSVTNTDNDAAGITVNPTSGLVTTEAGGTAQFTVVLQSQPTANVSIGLSSSDPTEGTVAPASVTFTSGNWNVAQAVTVTGVDDLLDDGNVAYTIVTAAATSADPGYNGLVPANVSVSNTDNDAAGITVNPTSGLVTTEAGGTAQFTIVLTAQPAANVAIGLTSSDLTEGTVAPATVTFTPANWSAAQTVTVTGVDDALVDGAIAYTVVTAPAVSADAAFNGLDPANVSVSNTDNDAAGVTVNPTSGLVTTEAGGTAQFTIVLRSQPVANVSIGLSSSDLTEGTVAPASVTFTPANWNVAQTVTVTGVDDPIIDGTIAYTIVTASATSADPVYNGLDPANVSVGNTDNDVAGITVSPTSGLVTTEAGGTATFTMVLTSQPAANVAVGLSSSDLTEGTVAPSSVTFTTGNWNVAQTVTVTGVDDFLDDGNIAYTIVTAPATSGDAAYNGINPSNVSVTNTDNDASGITVNPTSGLVTTEAGGTAQFTVVLTSQPTANVSIGLSSSDASEGTVAPASLTFTAANWNAAQTATVTGADDPLVDGPIVYAILTAGAVSADPRYNGINPPNVTVTNTDNDVAGVTVTPVTGLVTSEAGGTATFTVRLDSQPTGTVTIALGSSDPTEGTVAPVQLSFTALTWSAPQTVTVTGVDDPAVDGPVAYTIVTAAAVSTDLNYNGINPPDVSVTNSDNDAAGITVSPTAGLVTTEAGGTAQFTVVLNTLPSANVVVGLSSSDLTEGTVAPASLTFTPANWNAAQAVTVTGVGDFLADGNIAYTIVTAPATSADPVYNGLNPANVAVTNLDDDTAGVAVTPTAGLVTTEAGGTAQFTIVLTSQPTANVAIGLSSSDLTEGTVTPASLTFTAANWSAPRTVTVTGVDDVLDDGDIAYTVVTAPATSADPGYNGLNASDVSVTNTDNDAAGVAVNPVSGLVTTEAGGTAQFTVVLTSQPAASVTIGLSSSDITEGTVAPAGLTFTAANWNVAQTATVTGVDDAAADGPVAYTIVTAPAASTDPAFNGVNPPDVSVTNTDNDAAGFTVNPTAGLLTTEAGGTAQFTVVLTSQPVAGVTTALSSSDLTEGTVAPASLTFTSANWNVAQTVTVTGVDDLLDDGNIAYTIVTAPAVSTDPAYGGVNPANVGVTNTDDDAAGIAVAPVAGLVTSEAGATAQFTVVLQSQPTANVTVGLSSSDLTEGTVTPASLTFTATNWSVPRTATVTGVDDPAVDGNVAYTIVTAPATSADGAYSGLNPANVAVINTDDDIAGIAISPLAGLETSEGGGTATFTAVLTSQPSAAVTFDLATSDSTEGTVAPSGLTFTAANWNVPQTVTATGVDDVLDDGDVAYRVVTASAASTDANYARLDPADVEVTNRDDDSGAAVALELVPERERVGAGQPVRYTLTIRNRSPLALTSLEIRHELPPRFGYLEGSAARAGRGIADPGGDARVQVFPLDTLPGFVDLDGDGVPGPGERGHVTFAWTLAPGASATPGAYGNAAVALSLDACGGCQVSNRAVATVRVEEDAVFARGTILGRVFEDVDRDGRQGSGEPGLAGATIALDDGTRVTTDAEGRFHVPDLESGPRALKLDVARLGMPATPTSDVTQVVNVSPGLLATVRFGVFVHRDTVRSGLPMGEGLAIVTDPMEHAIHVAGNAFRGALVVNGRAVTVRTADARLESDRLDRVVRLDGDAKDSTTTFATDLSDTTGVARWWIELRTARDEVVRTLEGEGAPPGRVPWNGRLADDRRPRSGEVYAYQIRVAYADGTVIEGPRHAVAVDRGSTIAMTLPGDWFQPGKAQLSLAAGEPLAKLARMVLAAPREIVVIEGHTDSVGPSEVNRRLSLLRAEAVADYLVARQGVPRGRLVVEGHGESRPVADNASEDGRELNRRVEVYGMTSEVRRPRLYEVFRGEPVARVGGLEVAVDSAGRFACRAPMNGQDTVQVIMTNRFGRTGVARLRVPALRILEPRGQLLVPFGGSADGVRVEPRSALDRSSVALAGYAPSGGRPVAHLRLRGHTDAGNRVELDGEPVLVEPDGAFVAELAVHVGENAFGLTVRDPGGTQREANLIVRAIDQRADRDAVTPGGRDPELTIHLPPRGTVLGARELRLAGRVAPGSRVTANRDTFAVEADGRFLGTVTLPEGPSVMRITVEDTRGRSTTIERPVEVRSKRLFLVGLADGVVGRTQGGAFVGAGEGTRTWNEGRIAYQLKGWIAGRYLVSSAFDTRRRDFGTLFRDLDDAGRDRLLVNLDPDRLYPVFGDSSVVSHGGPAGGRFFLAVEGDALRASVGDFPIALDEVELATFHRTLWGGQLRLGREAAPGARASSLALFGAQARNVHVRDAIRATGGTLYYLSHREVIEGSVQVSLVVHDRDTGLPLRRAPLQRGLDYTAKELEGRLLFARPIPGVWEDGSLVDGDRLLGHPVTIEVDYETRGSIGEKSAVGARIKQGVGPLTLGATAVDDQAGAGRYQLRGGDVSLRLGRTSRLGFELAESEGRSGRTYASADGGLEFAPADTAAVRRGQAWKVAAELEPGEWRPRLSRLRLGGYVRRLESGFVAEDRPGGGALEQSGVRIGFDAGRLGQLSARLDQTDLGRTDSTGSRTKDVLGVLWRRDGARAGLATEFEQRSAGGPGLADSSASTIAGRLWWRPVAPLRATLERQQSVRGPDLERTSLGLDWQVLSRLTLGARGSAGSAGRTMRGDATLALGGRSAYLREERRDELGRRSSGTVFGVQAPLGARGRTYTEYQWQRDAAGERALSVLGLEQGWSSGDGLTLRVAGEHGDRAGVAGGAVGRRTTVSSDLSYRGRLPVSGATRGEVRMDGGAGRTRQYLVSSHLEWRLVAGFAVRGDYRLSLARQLDLGLTPARFEESSIGLAYRPARSDRVQALARVTRLADRRLRSPGDSLVSESGLDVAALEASVRLAGGLEWSGKGAARVMRDGPGGLPAVATHGALWVNRLDLTFRRPFRLGVEYRRLSQRETGDARGGWLQELSLDPSRHLRFGFGYNFTRFSGEVVDRGEENTRGWFVRAQSRY